MSAPEFTSHFITSTDGLKLHVRAIGERQAGTLPVVCLPGLARTTVDFETLARALARPLAGSGRQVLALDYRGRGLSDYASDPAQYSLPVELGDVLKVVAEFDVAPAVFIGTSRGGLLTMLLATVQPSAIAGVVLNDIGPVIEPAGLARITRYVGKLPQPRDYAHGAQILRGLFADQFPTISDAGWLATARRTFKDENGRLVPTYDVALAKNLEAFDPAQPVPALWEAFDALAAVPVMVVRGALSDILSARTVADMHARRADLQAVEVAEQGHAPLLDDPETIGRIVAFVEGCERLALPSP